MRKFILIDPSITDVGGHYYGYAIRVLDEASRHGFEPVLATNRRARRLAPRSCVIPAYRYTFFEPGPPRALRWVRRMATLALRGVRPPRTAIQSRDGQGCAGRPGSFYLRRKRRAFFADSRRLFRELPLSTGDIVFLPTVAEADMLGLADLFRADCNTTKAAWHLLFRRDVPRGHALSDRLRRHFEQFASQSFDHRVSFYTDTDPLTTQYNLLGAAVFRTLPIPVRRIESDSQPPAAFGPGRLCHVVYLGDARTEKGYHRLPDLVNGAKRAGLPVRFTLQSNFNMPGGEPAAAEARRQLASLPADSGVTLITEPLSSDTYFRLLRAADVVVVPYDAAAYQARSSGVFAEALAAGKPVIVPEGTWMAEELRRAGREPGIVYRDLSDLTANLAKIVRGYGSYHAAAQDYLCQWSTYHSPKALLERILVGSETDLVPLYQFA